MNKITNTFLGLVATFQIASADVKNTKNHINKDLNKTVEMKTEIKECPLASGIIYKIDSDENSTSEKEDFQDLISKIWIIDFKAMIEYSVSVDENLSAEWFLKYAKENKITINKNTKKILEKEVENEKKQKIIQFELMKKYHNNLLHSK